MHLIIIGFRFSRESLTSKSNRVPAKVSPRFTSTTTPFAAISIDFHVGIARFSPGSFDIPVIFDFLWPFVGVLFYVAVRASSAVPPVSISCQSIPLPLRGYQSRYKLHINLSAYPFQAVAARFFPRCKTLAELSRAIAARIPMNNAWLNFIDAGALHGAFAPVKPARFPGTFCGTFALHRLGNSAGIVGCGVHIACRLLPNITKCSRACAISNARASFSASLAPPLATQRGFR